MKFMEILSVEAALKAVESDGDALRYVFEKELFISLAAKFCISIEL